MTKLEAWKAWCVTAGTESLANPFTLENSSHGKAFSFAWDAAYTAGAASGQAEANRLKSLCEEMLSELYVYRASEYLKDVTAAIRARSKQ